MSTSFNSASTEKEAWHEALVFNLEAGATTTLTAYSDRAYWDYINAVWNYSYSSNTYYTFTAAPHGTYSYTIECWGAQGGTEGSYIGGKGAYTKGTLSLEKNSTLYVYTGACGDRGSSGAVFNNGTVRMAQSNGSYYHGAGGGSTDIRLTNGAWNNFESLKSRIMVAAGGGGEG